MIGHACPRDNRISHGEAHPLQTGNQSAAAGLAPLLCLLFKNNKKKIQQQHIVLFCLKLKKKRNKSELKPLKGKGEVSLGEENAAFKEGTEATARETLPLQGLSWRVECV